MNGIFQDKTDKRYRIFQTVGGGAPGLLLDTILFHRQHLQKKFAGF
jgi:hypothetical protein